MFFFCFRNKAKKISKFTGFFSSKTRYYRLPVFKKRTVNAIPNLTASYGVAAKNVLSITKILHETSDTFRLLDN